MDIIFCFQGEVVYSISLPRNTISASFELNNKSEVYKGIEIGMPFIKNIQFKDSNNKTGD